MEDPKGPPAYSLVKKFYQASILLLIFFRKINVNSEAKSKDKTI